MIHILQYGNTRTYYICCSEAGILVDTDWAGTLPTFFREIKQHNIRVEAIKYLLITHYHPDHMGLAGQMQELGITLLILEEQWNFIHSSDSVFQKEKRRDFKPVMEEAALRLSCGESRRLLKKIGVQGEIIHTPGHSEDSVSLILDEGAAFVGDLCPVDTVPGYCDEVLESSWRRLLTYNLRVVYYGHAEKREVSGIILSSAG